MEEVGLPKFERALKSISKSLLVIAIILVVFGLVSISIGANSGGGGAGQIPNEVLVGGGGLIGGIYIGVPSLVIFLIIKVDEHIRGGWNKK